MAPLKVPLVDIYVVSQTVLEAVNEPTKVESFRVADGNIGASPTLKVSNVDEHPVVPSNATTV